MGSFQWRQQVVNHPSKIATHETATTYCTASQSEHCRRRPIGRARSERQAEEKEDAGLLQLVVVRYIASPAHLIGFLALVVAR